MLAVAWPRSTKKPPYEVSPPLPYESAHEMPWNGVMMTIPRLGGAPWTLARPQSMWNMFEGQ